MKLPEIFQGINLSAEPGLLELIGKDVIEKHEDVEDIVVIGTDPKFKLAGGLRDIFPGTKITVIDRNEDVETWAEETFLNEENVRVVVGEIGGKEMESVDKADLVIAKHLIHFIPNDHKGAVLREMEEMMGEEGTLLLSVPYIVDLLFKIEIEGLEDRIIEKVNAGRWPAKSAVWIITKK